MIAKKNLVAAAALMAVAAAAQAQVKLYGALDYYVGSVENAHKKDDPSRKTVVDGGGMMTSFFGISGSEDLGGGLKAEFALESFINGDTGATGPNMAGGFWGRGSNIALSKDGLGKVAIGQYDNPLFTAGYTYNPFGSSMVASPTMRHYYSKVISLGFDTGWVNSLTYESPIFSGAQLVAQFAPKETKASGTGNSYALAGYYNAGPLSATVSYTSAGRTSTFASVATPTTSKTAYLAAQKVANIGTSYDFGAAKAFFQYTDVKTSSRVELDPDNGDITGLDTVGSKATIYQLGVAVPLNDKATVMASYGADKTKSKAPGAKSSTDKVLSLGYDYLLSKRTDVYGLFVHNSQTGMEAGKTLAVGIKHNF
jgi:predicted porin